MRAAIKESRWEKEIVLVQAKDGRARDELEDRVPWLCVCLRADAVAPQTTRARPRRFLSQLRAPFVSDAPRPS